MSLKSFLSWLVTDPKKKSAKKLSNTIILFILINSMLGSSLFYLPGLGVQAGGAASLLAWAAVFLIALGIMVYVGELVTTFPSAGGTYDYCKRAYGRFGAFMAGWLIWIAGNFGMALGVVAAAEYFIPTSYANYFVIRLIFAGIWILLLNAMAYRGIDAGTTMLVIFGALAVIVVSLMTLPSFLNIPALLQGSIASPFQLELLTPFFRQEGLTNFFFLAMAMFFISEAFFGFEVVTYLANEVEHPEKLHKVLLVGTCISGAIMLLYVFSSLGIVSFGQYVSDARPFAVQALTALGSVGQTVVVFGMYLVIVGTAAAWPISGSRLLKAMASDKLFIEHFAEPHPKHRSPYRAVIFQTMVISIFSWFIFRGYVVQWSNPYRAIYLIYVFLSFIVLSMVLLCVPILRHKDKTPRVFQAPLGTFGPLALIVVLVLMVLNWIYLETGTALSNISLAVSFLLLGLPFYFFVEMLYNQKAILAVNERLSFLVVLQEKLFFPFSIKKQLLKHMEAIHGRVILEFGCAVGSLTKHLAERVLPGGRIYATDISLHNIQLVAKRMSKHAHVSVHHHPHLDDFKLKLPEQVDGVVSIGMLSYFQDPQKILSALAKHVKPGGEIIFVDYDKFFYVIPNVKWVEHDDQLKAVFSHAGFDVTIERKRGLLWQYILVTGSKR